MSTEISSINIFYDTLHKLKPVSASLRTTQNGVLYLSEYKESCFYSVHYDKVRTQKKKNVSTIMSYG